MVDGASVPRQYFQIILPLCRPASMMIALPTLVVYLALRKQFISGLTLGANKG